MASDQIIQDLRNQVHDLSVKLTAMENLLYRTGKVVLPPRVSLNQIPMRILMCLIAANGSVFSFTDLCEAVYTGGRNPGKPVLKVHVSNLRRDLFPHCKIITHVGVGYSLDPDSLSKLQGKEPWP